MSLRASPPVDLTHEASLFDAASWPEDTKNDIFDQWMDFGDLCHRDEPSPEALMPNSPDMASAPSTEAIYGQNSYRLSQAGSDAGYWSNYSRPQSPVARGRSKTSTENPLLRHKRRPDSEILDFQGISLESPPRPIHAQTTLRHRKNLNRSVSSFRSVREPSRETDSREQRRSTRSTSRSAIRKQRSPSKMSKVSGAGADAYQVSLEEWTQKLEWNQKLQHQASQFDFGFPNSNHRPISPPPSARVSDASSHENTHMMRARHAQHQQTQQNSQWDNPQAQYTATSNAHILTPLTTPRFNEIAVEQNGASYGQPQQWSSAELQQGLNAFDMSFSLQPDQWWQDDQAQQSSSDQGASPVVLTHNESFPQPMAISPVSGRLNSKSLSVSIQQQAPGPEWPTIDTNIPVDVDVDLALSPGVRPTPINPTSQNPFTHAHTQSLPATANHLLLPNGSMPPSPTRIVAAEPSPLRHQKSGSYFSNVAPPPFPAHLQSQQASPQLSQHPSPMRHNKSRRQLTMDDHSSPPSRSVSPSLYSQSFPDGHGLGFTGQENAMMSHPNFNNGHPYTLQVRKRLSHKGSEPSFAGHHQRGRSSQLSAAGYSIPSSHSQSFPTHSGSPSPRMNSRAHSRSHGRSKSSSNLRSTSSGKRSSSKKDKATAQASMAIEFQNFTPHDGQKILNGVAPSGSSKTKARREKEAQEKRRRMSEIAMRALRDAGGDVGQLAGMISDDGMDVSGNEEIEGLEAEGCYM